MTAAELIRALREFPGDMEVLVTGYEEGMKLLADVRIVRATSGHSFSRWSGDYEEDPEGEEYVYLPR